MIEKLYANIKRFSYFLQPKKVQSIYLATKSLATIMINTKVFIDAAVAAVTDDVLALNSMEEQNMCICFFYSNFQKTNSAFDQFVDQMMDMYSPQW